MRDAMNDQFGKRAFRGRAANGRYPARTGHSTVLTWGLEWKGRVPLGPRSAR
jgi:hypothetical protein